jgi:16S rRNA (uracil1498-N3)-methyltransferase
MSKHRFYLSPDRWNPAASALDEADSHHCCDVLRLGKGDRVVVFDGEGREATAELLEVTRKQVRLMIGEIRETPKLACSLILAQAVPKGKNMDLVLQKGVELGAAAIIPLLSERTVVRIEDERDEEKKRDRWRSIVIEACKQCGQNWAPDVGLPLPMEKFLSGAPIADLTLIASLQSHSQPIRQALASYRAATGAAPGSVAILVGPEGDFTPEETSQALAAGAVPVTLGPIVLRTETAALYCLSVLGHELF